LVRVEYGPGLEAPPDPDAFRRRGEVVAELVGDPLDSGSRALLKDAGWTGLSERGVDWTLRYAVRVRDRRGRPSPLVAARDLVSVAAPLPPGNVRAEATGDGVRLVWDPPPGDGPFRYNLYRSEGSAPPGERPLHGGPLSSTEYLDSGVRTGLTYRYEVRTAASDTAPYRESVSSDSVMLLAEDRFPPIAPTGLVAIQEGAAIRLFWNPNQEKDLGGYRVYRRQEGDWSRTGPDPVPEPLFLDSDVRPGERLVYRVTAVDRATPPNESPPSEEVDVDVARDLVRPGESPNEERP
jgi:hypothetical protein